MIIILKKIEMSVLSEEFNFDSEISAFSISKLNSSDILAS
jgi:hypothetical protein